MLLLQNISICPLVLLGWMEQQVLAVEHAMPFQTAAWLLQDMDLRH